MFKPIKRKRLYVEVMEQIHQLINEGTLKPGDKLISERELAERLQVSRSSIREAFSALELMGILESRPGEGTFIRTVNSEEAIRPLTLMMMLEKESTGDLLEVRKILEGESAFLAAERVTEEGLQKIELFLNEMEQDLKDGNIGEEPDANFHFAVAGATGNRILMKMMSYISDLLVYSMKVSRERMFKRTGNKEKLFWQHKNIFNAIKERDPHKARRVMTEHLDFVSRELFSEEKYAEDQEKEHL